MSPEKKTWNIVKKIDKYTEGKIEGKYPAKY